MQRRAEGVVEVSHWWL